MFGWFKRKKKKVYGPVEQAIIHAFDSGEVNAFIDEADPDRVNLVIAMLSLLFGFNEVRSLESEKILKPIILESNVDILGLECALYYMKQCENYLHFRIEESTGGKKFSQLEEPHELEREFIQPIRKAVRVVSELYGMSYPKEEVKAVIHDRYSYYSRWSTDARYPHEKLLEKVQLSVGKQGFSDKNRMEVGGQQAVLLNMLLMTSYTENVPNYIKMLDKNFEEFLGIGFNADI